MLPREAVCPFGSRCEHDCGAYVTCYVFMSFPPWIVRLALLVLCLCNLSRMVVPITVIPCMSCARNAASLTMAYGSHLGR